jgi:chromosome segregation and condensation protein ScpB
MTVVDEGQPLARETTNFFEKKLGLPSLNHAFPIKHMYKGKS